MTSSNFFDVFKSMKGLIKLEEICIDHNVFRLHYKATVILLCVFSLMITAKQYFGDPIDCLADNPKKIPSKVLNNFCWIHATFTITNESKDEIYPGVAPKANGDQVKYHKYYQWVSFVLFFQAILFYLPRYLWKTWEGGRLKMLALDLNRPIEKEDSKEDRKKLLVEYLVSHLHHHNFYALRFFFCEMLNFINVVGQMYFMDVFLDGEFTTYGLDVWRFTEMEPEQRRDSMSRVFPKVTKCTFHKYGPSGTVENYDGLCVLPLNIVNEKIYVFLWFWFVLLSIVTGLSLLYRLGTVTIMRMRVYLLRCRARFGPFKEIELITQISQVGDWFILYQLARNIDPLIYKKIIHDISRKLNKKELV